MPSESRIALVLGATGGIGGETALALSRHGWKIRAFSRGTLLLIRLDGNGSKVMPLTERPCSPLQRAYTPSCTR